MKVLGRILAAAQVMVLIGLPHAQAQTPSFDLIIVGGKIVDGTGNPWFIGDVAINGDTIVAIAPHIDAGSARVISAAGLVVSPGFIDIHSHSEAAGQGLSSNPAAENNVRQGVTTVIANPDGFGDAALAPFLASVRAARPAINMGAFIGHGAVRESVMGRENRAATASELERMRAAVRTGMQDGAFGLSTGLFYVPANYAPTEEVIALAAEAGRYGGIHQSHMRDEAARVLDSVRETIAIGELGHLPTQITHHKIIGKANWGMSVETLKLVDEARTRGFDVSIDQYPYTASATNLDAGLIPQWAQAGGRAQLLARLADADTGARIRASVADAIDNDRGGGNPANVMLTACDFDNSLAGKTLADILRGQNKAVTSTTAAEVVADIVQKGICGAVFHAIAEDDLVRILKHPATMIASDSFPGEPQFGKDAPHPRAYGTFARVLSVYVREKHVLSLEEAIRKMSSMPAIRLRITDRGILRAGMKADIAVFDPETVADLATFERPHQYAVGVRHVLVNGELILSNGAATKNTPGRILYGPGYNKTR